MVQVRAGAIKGHRDVVAAEVEGFVVEGLVQVADELGIVLIDDFIEDRETENL